MTGRDDSTRKGRPDARRDEAFVQDVMRRTAGSACGRCGDQLPDLVTGGLDDLDRQLVQAHLEHCEGCRATAVTLGWLTPMLPEMAELDPGDAFTTAVLERTTYQRRRETAGPAGAAGVMDRLGRWWERQILKPQFAAQVAYAATVLLVLLTAVPGAPLRGAPGKALEIVQAGPGTVPVVGTAIVGVSGWIGDRTDATITRVSDAATDRWLAARTDLSRRAGRTATDRAALGGHLDAMATRLSAGELGEAGTEFYAVMKLGGSIWTNWWDTNDDVGP